MAASSSLGRLVRRTPWHRSVGATLPVAFVALAAACGDSFVSDGEGACQPPSCEGAGPSCRSYDFSGESCHPDWEITGDLSQPNVVGECTGGKLRVACDDTLDVVAALWLEAPSSAYSMSTAARIAVQTWDGGPVLALLIDNVPTFELRAEETPSGTIRYDLCDESTCPASFEAQPGEEHLFQLDVTAAMIAATVDCQPLGELPGPALPRDTWMRLEFGHMDGFPIDGTLDDVVVSFR